VHSGWADEDRDEEQHPPEEGHDQEQDGKVSQEPDVPEVVWRNLTSSARELRVEGVPNVQLGRLDSGSHYCRELEEEGDDFSHLSRNGDE
jgi:hypothetical protein